ncbi:helix-turn-helix domain-containing protein [Tateyamaria pelophila]|uniref:helix-turn-helix domain-containing protein n=1 Tax=Tateyamaria pelophila TaxID=328415 RepID=UPI001CC01C00|nr:helix-turn-helix domain-containing protein [Tateyamaria pelophila]
MAVKIELLTPEEKAAELKVSTETLKRWRRLGKGPVFKRISRQCIRYLPEMIEEDAA